MALAASAVLCASAALARGDALITFPKTVSPFDNGDIGATANFTDPTANQTTALTTVAINTAGSGVGRTFVDANDRLGVGLDDDFGPNQSWTFRFSSTIFLKGIDFHNLGSEEQLALQSNDWIGLDVTPVSGLIVFNSTTGTFTFTNKPGPDHFTLDDLTGGQNSLRVFAGTNIVLSNPSSGSASLQDIVVEVVPEPPSLLLAVTGSGIVCALRSRRVRRTAA